MSKSCSIQTTSKSRTVYMFCHYAQQPPYNTALRYHNWGKILVSRGYNITIISASSVHNTNIDVIVKLHGKSASECDGIRYIYIKTKQYTGNGIGRIRNMVEYYGGIKQVSMRLKKPCIVICCGAYLEKRVHSLWKDVPCVCDIEDLWPESIADVMKISKKNPLMRMLYRNERRAYEDCDALIFSIPGGYQYITDKEWNRSIDSQKVFHINMGVDLEEFDKNKDTILYDDSELTNGDLFKVVYCGSVRAANCVKAICEVAKLLQQQGFTSIRFMIHGSGTQVNELKKYCTANDIRNIRFYGRIDKKQIPYVLAHADICLLTFIDAPIMRYGGSQQKSFEYYASGKPIVSNWNSGYNLIKKYRAGIVTDSQKPEELAASIIRISQMPQEERLAMGRNARKIAEDFDQHALVDQLEAVFDYIMHEQKEIEV